MKTTTSHDPNTNIYKYIADIKYALGNQVYNIEPTSIRTIAIDSNYDEMNMPMIFITLGVYQSMANRMILNQKTGTFLLDIKRAVANSDMPDLYSDYISDKFIYFITGNIDEDTNTVDIQRDDPDDDTIVTLGLLSLDHVNSNKRTVNGVLNGKLSSIMYYLTSHLPILIEPPKNNISIVNKIMPPIDSVAKSLRYMNNINVFYSTPYRFFMDFDTSYLISSSGKPVRANGENISSIMITIYHEDDDEAKIQGMSTNKNQALYEMFASSKDCEISDNSLSDKQFSRISVTNTSGVRKSIDISVSTGSIINTKTKSVRILNDNDGLLENMASSVDNSAIQLLVQKTDIDSAIFTINKEYLIRAEHAYNTEKYNGRYILSRKRELFIRDDETFTVNVMLLFKKVSDD